MGDLMNKGLKPLMETNLRCVYSCSNGWLDE